MLNLVAFHCNSSRFTEVLVQVKYAPISGLKILSKEEKRVKALITMFKVNNIPLQFSTIFLTDRDHLQDMRNEYLFIILVPKTQLQDAGSAPHYVRLQGQCE